VNMRSSRLPVNAVLSEIRPIRETDDIHDYGEPFEIDVPGYDLEEVAEDESSTGGY